MTTKTIPADQVTYVENRIRAAHARAQARKADHVRVVPDQADTWLGWKLELAHGDRPDDIPIPETLANGDLAAIVRRLVRQGWLHIEQ